MTTPEILVSRQHPVVASNFVWSVSPLCIWSEFTLIHKSPRRDLTGTPFIFLLLLSQRVCCLLRELEPSRPDCLILHLYILRCPHKSDYLFLLICGLHELPPNPLIEMFSNRHPCSCRDSSAIKNIGSRRGPRFGSHHLPAVPGGLTPSSDPNRHKTCV